MKKEMFFWTWVIILLALLCFTASPATLISAETCKGVNIVGSTIICTQPTTDFSTDDQYVYFVSYLNVYAGDILKIEIYGPAGNVVDSLQGNPITVDFPNSPFFYSMSIAGKTIGSYEARLSNKNAVLVSKTFSISQPDYGCAQNGFVCCSGNNLCLNPADSKYTCTSGTCCNPSSCAPVIPGGLTVRVVPDCTAEGLKECHRIIGNVYDYTPHGALATPASVELVLRDVDIDCFNKNNIAIGVYDEANLTNGTSAWKVYDSTVTKLAGGYYSVTASLDYVGYIAVLRSPACVPTDCWPPGFKTVPFDGMVSVNDVITLGVCQIARSCDASADGICDRKCTQDLDPDCGVCTSSINDCCSPELDGVCDVDCSSNVDPDCADDSYLDGLCYPSSSDRRGFSACDIHCTGADASCTIPGCNPSSDSVCNPNCPKLSNGIGYLDIDCCTQEGIPVTNAKGDCCNTDKDTVCDPDCIPGLDPDCNKMTTQANYTYTPEQKDCSHADWCDCECYPDTCMATCGGAGVGSSG